MAFDTLGDRMKGQYENRTRYMLPRRTYTIVRVDGKAFHSYTRQCDKPFDKAITAAMDSVAELLCCEMQGSRLAYVQSDEISVLLTDFATVSTEAWFDGNVQKIVSVAASYASMVFNSSIVAAGYPPAAVFDARVFTIPDPIEVENYFIWRQQDATRNSIQSVAQAHFSHKSMHGLNTSQLQERLFTEKGINWSDLPTAEKRGRCIVRPMDGFGWVRDHDIPVFTQNREYLSSRITPENSHVAVSA